MEACLLRFYLLSDFTRESYKKKINLWPSIPDDFGSSYSLPGVNSETISDEK